MDMLLGVALETEMGFLGNGFAIGLGFGSATTFGVSSVLPVRMVSSLVYSSNHS
jgi:hypothetical protein